MVRVFALGIALPFASGAPAGAQADCQPLPRILRPSTVFLPCEVTDPVQWRTAPAPVYPPLLASAHVEGGVLLQFIVTTAGGVDTSSIKTLKSTHDLFTQAARRVLTAWRARPARFRGTPVAEWIQHTFVFLPTDTVPCPAHDRFDWLGETTVSCLPRRTHHGPAARTPPGRESPLINR